MISTEHKKSAKNAMEIALKNGCSAARVSVYTGSKSSFENRNDVLDRLEQASENTMVIEVFVNDRYGSYSTNRFEKDILEKFIISAIESTKYLDSDPARTLPDPSRYYKGSGEDLNLHDSAFDKLSAEEKADIAKCTVAEIYKTDPRIISVSANYDDSENFEYTIASNGFEGHSSSSSCFLSAEVSLKSEDGARPNGSWYETSIFADQLIKTGVGKKALERALRKLGQTKIKSGKYPMLLENMQVRRLLIPLISALYGSQLQQKNSFLLNKLGQKIVSDKLTLTDDPHLKSTSGARWFDEEGVATQKRQIIENGILKTYYIDTYNANKMKVEPTIQSPSTILFALGSKNHSEIMSTVKKGIWVTQFNGGNSNSTTGDFSFGIEGLLIENGDVIKPVSEMNITGNLLELWTNIAEIGNDPLPGRSWQCPAMLFDSVDFSGI